MSEQKVVICKDLKSELQDFLSSLKYDELFIPMDTNTKEKCFPLVEDMPALRKAPILVMEAGDVNRGFVSLAQIWTVLSNEGASRNSLLVNLDDGMITNMGGSTGTTFKRGIRTIDIPTTLMASVDAAVGGKTGINFNGLKNGAGSFYLPLCVFIDYDFPHTLDRNNILSGYAEMAKRGLVSSMENYASVMLFDIDTVNYSYLNSLVDRSVAVKKRIVEKDPKEQGIRRTLSFGHTIGHAFEDLSFLRMHPILHGHAVTTGIVSELYLSHKLCSFPMEKLSQVVYCIKEYYLALFFDYTDYDTLYELMTRDKKNEGGIINSALLKNVGDVRINRSVTKGKILGSLDFYHKSFGI